MVKIERLEIKGLYSFKQKTVIEFASNNLIIGHNNAGKTNIFRIMKLIIPALVNPYNIKNNIRFNKKDELPILELDVTFSKEEMSDLSKFLVFCLMGNSQKSISELNPFFNKFSKLRTFTIRIEFPDTGGDRSDDVNLMFIEKTSGLVINNFTRNSPHITTINNLNIFESGKISNPNSISELVTKQKISLKKFNPKLFVEFIDKTNEGFILRGLRNAHSNIAADIRSCKLLMGKYADENQELHFFQVIGKIILSKMSYMSDRRQIGENPKQKIKRLSDDGSDLASYLHGLKSNKEESQQKIFAEIKRQFSNIFNKKINFETYEEEKRDYIENKLITKTVPKITFYIEKLQFDDNEVGSGVLEILFLIVKSITEKESLILLDEPALHLHPIQIKRMFEQIQKNIIKSKSQLFVISHSTDLPLITFLEKTNQLIYVRIHKKSSIISQLDTSQKSKILGSIPKLKFDLSSDLFFAKSVVLVEGDSDLGLLEGLATRKNIEVNQRDVLIKPINGKDNLTLLLQILEYYKIPKIVMVDNDALIQISQKTFSRVMYALNEIDHTSVELFLKKLGSDIFEYDIRSPWWVDKLQNEMKKVNSKDVTKFVDGISKNHQNKIKIYKKSIHHKLLKFALKRKIFVISEGAIEDLMNKIDPKLYQTMKKDYRSKRIRAQKYVEKLDSKKLSQFKIPYKILTTSISEQ